MDRQMVQLITSANELTAILENISSIGLVPTMGNLHKGHLSLIKKSISENKNTIISIFVNPKQFSPNEDFTEYPRTLEQDLSKIKNTSKGKNVYVFSPKSIEEVYPPNFSTTLRVPSFENKLCAISRPNHFEGVCTVIYRLFTLIKPNQAYFGQKDFQQLCIIKAMSKDLFPKIKIIGVPIYRDSNGLALSSRNKYLSINEKKDALHLFKTLKNMAEQMKMCWPNIKKLSQLTTDAKNLPIATNIRWDYLSIIDANTLEQVRDTSTQVIIAGSLYVNKIRLIDNILINKES